MAKRVDNWIVNTNNANFKDKCEKDMFVKREQ